MPGRPWQQPLQQSAPVEHAWAEGCRHCRPGTSGGMQQRRVGASGSQKAPCVGHCKGAETRQGSVLEHTPVMEQQPLQQAEPTEHPAPSGKQAPPSRLTG